MSTKTKENALIRRAARMGFEVHQRFDGFTIIETASDHIVGVDMTLDEAVAWLKKEGEELWYLTDEDGLTRRIG